MKILHGNAVKVCLNPTLPHPLLPCLECCPGCHASLPKLPKVWVSESLLSLFRRQTTVVHKTANKRPLFKEPKQVAAGWGSEWRCGWNHLWRPPKYRQGALPDEISCVKYPLLVQVVDSRNNCLLCFCVKHFSYLGTFFFLVSYFGILCVLRFLTYCPSDFRSL